MKHRYVPIISLTLAIVLVGSIAYSAEKRKKARLIVHEPSEMSEETLRDELLAATEAEHKKTPVTKAASSKTSAAVHTANIKVK